ncbi:hypothetical protein B0J13DRAFT_524585 [Dactylonectria estremocensis]|uniref:Kinesin light chain n=1 Tax=Dactylonectria estremocensis TaxID=1079267 RepID=A0A9P9EX34_9HYPO|nr:hypothetical protein B0J13DRAFT_524585 [Dactylonectria estremocensis]
MPLEKHSTSPSTNTPTDPNPVVPGDRGNTGWLSIRTGARVLPNGEDPGSPYEAFASGPQSGPLRGPGHGTSPTQKPRRRRQARKPTQPTRGPQGSGKIQKKQSERSKRDSNASITASGRPVTPGMQKALQLFQEQLELLEERKTVLGEEHHHTLSNMANLAMTWKDQSRSRDALALIRNCVALRQRELGIDHPDAASSSATLATWEAVSDQS